MAFSDSNLDISVDRDSVSLHWFSVDPLLERLKWSDAIESDQNDSPKDNNGSVIELNSITEILPCQVF